MKLTRRNVLQGMAGSVAISTMSPSFGMAGAGYEVLKATPGKARLVSEDYPETDIWGYGGQVPGPTIRLRQGERVQRRFQNGLPQASTIHWHGIRIDNAMDGVPGLSQAVVEPGSEFTYDFTVPDAGTYWYHPHNRTWEQMARGLYGPLIVEEVDGGPAVDQDIALMLDDWRLTKDAQIADGFGNLHDWAHAGRIGNWITVNGHGDWRQEVNHGDRLRLRLINTANARIFTLRVKGLTGWVVALDGMPLHRVEALTEVTLGPAQRIDVIVDVTAGEGEDAFLFSLEREGEFALASFPVTGIGQAQGRAEPSALPPNPVPQPGALETARKVVLKMEGGAMGRLAGATLNGEHMDMRSLAAQGKVWAFNGAVDMQQDPLIHASLGETVWVEMQNETAWPHAMHLHGHHFRQLFPDGETGPLRDTLLMQPREKANILFVADNPGDWLLHCHMLEHAASGMMTWVRVD